MKGLIFYFSGTGTTKLAVDYIASKITNVDFDFHNMYHHKIPDIKGYDIVGFATYAQLFYPPKYVEEFIKKIEIQEKKYAFVFNTYGAINGDTLKALGTFVKERGFTLIDAYALHTPESSPKMIMQGIKSENAPNEKELEKFYNFINVLGEKLDRIAAGEEIKEVTVKTNNPTVFLRKLLTGSKFISIGEKHVKEDKCIKCGKCEKVCPYAVINLDGSFPKFNEAKCESCFICYNQCPKQAIYSEKCHRGHYPKPNENIVNKLKN